MAAELHVLQSFRAMGADPNPYLQQLLDETSALAQTRTFTWRNALLWRFDVLHVHWAQSLINTPRANSAPGRIARRALNRTLFLALLAKLRMRDIPVVLTAHNLRPHEEHGRMDRFLTERLLRRSRIWIRLNAFTPSPADSRTVTILHGDYRAWLARYPKRDAHAGRLVFFGHIRAYKGVEELIEAFGELDSPEAALRLVGKPGTTEFGAIVGEAAQRDPRIVAKLGYAEEATLVDEITSAQVAVLPYRHMHNSGVALLCLSLGRPVLLPDNEVNRALAEEVGPGWLHFFDGQIRPADLEAALAAPRPAQPPRLERREWHDAGTAHIAAYRLALASRGDDVIDLTDDLVSAPQGHPAPEEPTHADANA